MSKHKIRYILPLLAVMASAVFVPNLLTKWMKIV